MNPLFRRLIRPNAAPIDAPWPDEASPPQGPLTDPLWRVETSPVARRSGIPVTMFRGDLPAPVGGPPITPIHLDRPTDVRAANYAKARHGVGLFGIESLIPEGETS